ncbi:MAG: response regulator [Syntrophales bacterium]|jgi:two-component system KDP operon response regulator KdpE|nr:response regulator [Syntrophales bacterium]
MNEIPATILLIEDERQMRRFLRVALQSEKYAVLEAETAADGLSQAATRNPDIVLLDLGLPDMDGLEVIEKLREWTALPVIVISAREQEGDKIKALDGGADDYLTKPFCAGELLARIRVALRHATPKQQGQEDAVFIAEDLKIDFLKRQVFSGSKEIHLTPIEYRLLTVLVRNAGRVMTHRQILKEVWGPPYVEQTHYLRVFMNQLRKKIETDSARPRFLLNEPGVGYRFKQDLD